MPTNKHVVRYYNPKSPKTVHAEEQEAESYRLKDDTKPLFVNYLSKDKKVAVKSTNLLEPISTGHELSSKIFVDSDNRSKHKLNAIKHYNSSTNSLPQIQIRPNASSTLDKYVEESKQGPRNRKDISV